ncbi:hypothetical protein D3C84_502300 [compost metagenome]
MQAIIGRIERQPNGADCLEVGQFHWVKAVGYFRLTNHRIPPVLQIGLGTHRRGKRQLIGLIQLGADGRGAAPGRLQEKPVIRRRGRIDGQFETLVAAARIGEGQGRRIAAGRAGADRHGRAIAQASRAVVAAIVIQTVVAGGQDAAVGDIQRRLDVAGVGRISPHPQLGQRRVVVIAEQRGAHLAFQVQALAELAVDLIADRQGQSPQGVEGRIQGLAAIADQPAQLATAEQGGDALARAAADEAHLETRRVALPRPDFQAAGAAAHHQRLAGANEQVERVVILRHHGHTNEGGQLADRLFAGIEQVVGLLTVGRGLGDGIVVAGNRGRQAIDLVADGHHLLVDELVLLADPVGNRIEAPGQAFRLGQHQLPRRNVGRVFGGRLQGREELLHRGRDAGGGAGQQRIELFDLAPVGFHVAAQRGAAAHLGAQELAVGAADIHQGGARADIAGTAELRIARGLHRVLAAKPGGVDVSDVMPGDRQRGLVRRQAGQADTQ